MVELIIVIAIMAVVVGALAPQFVKWVEMARESKDLENIEEIKKAVEAYSADHEHKGIHKIEADGSVIKYTLGDGGSLENYGIEDQVVQSSSDRIVAVWSYVDCEWKLEDYCEDNGAFYDGYGNRI